eukprot:2260378-Amphidinium_carterae.1
MGFDDVNDLNGHCCFSVSQSAAGFYAELVCPDASRFVGPVMNSSRLAAAKVAHVALHHYRHNPLCHVGPTSLLESQSLTHFRRSFSAKLQELHFEMRVKRLAKAITSARALVNDDGGQPSVALAERVCLAEHRDGLAEGFDVLTVALGPPLARKTALFRFPRGSAGMGLRESINPSAISEAVFTTITGLKVHPALEDLSGWGPWQGADDVHASSSTAAVSSAAEPSLPSTQSAVVLSEAELRSLYGIGYKLLCKQGFSGTAPAPLVGIPRPERAGLRDDESSALSPAARRLLASHPRDDSVRDDSVTEVIAVEGGMNSYCSSSDEYLDLLIVWQLMIRQAYRSMVSISSLRAMLADYLLRDDISIAGLLTQSGEGLTAATCRLRTTANHVRGHLLDFRILAEIFSIDTEVYDAAGRAILDVQVGKEDVFPYGNCSFSMSADGAQFHLISWQRWHDMSLEERPLLPAREVEATHRVAQAIMEFATPLPPPISPTAVWQSPISVHSVSHALFTVSTGTRPPVQTLTSDCDSSPSSTSSICVEGGMRPSSQIFEARSDLYPFWQGLMREFLDIEIDVPSLQANLRQYLQNDTERAWYIERLAREAVSRLPTARELFFRQLFELLGLASMDRVMVTVNMEGGDALLVFPRVVHNIRDWVGSCSVVISYSATRFRLLSWIEWPAEHPPAVLERPLDERPPIFSTSPQQAENDLYSTWSEVMIRTYGIPVSTRALRVLVAKYISAPEMPLQQLLELAAIGLRVENYPSRFSYVYVRNQIFELVVLSRVFRTMIAVTNSDGQWIAASPGDDETCRQCFGRCVLKMAPSGSTFAVQEVIRWHQMRYTELPPDASDAAVLLHATHRMQTVSENMEEAMGVLYNLHVPVSALYIFGASLFASLSSSSSSSTRRSRASHMSGAAAGPGASLFAELQANTSSEATLISDARPTIQQTVTGGTRGVKRRKRMASNAVPPRDTPPGCGALCSAQGQDLRVPHGCLLVWPSWLHPQENEVNSRDMFNICLTLEEQDPKYIAVPDEWSRPRIEHAIADHLSVAHSWLLFVWEGNTVSVKPEACFPQVLCKEYDDLYDSCSAMPAPRGRRPGMFSAELVIGHRGSRKRGLTKFTTEHPDVSKTLVCAANQFSPLTTFNAIAIVHHRQVPIHRDVMNDALHQMVLIPLQGESWLWVESTTGTDALAFDDEELTGSWHPFTRAFSFMGAAAHALQSEDPCCSLAMYRTARMPRFTHVEELHHLGFNLSDAETALLDRGDPQLPPPTEDEASSSESIPAGAIAKLGRAVRDDASAGGSDAAAPLESADEDQPASEPGVEVITDPELGADDQVVKVSFAKTGRGGVLLSFQVCMRLGGDVLQARQLIKKHLKLNIARIALTHWDGLASGDELADEYMFGQDDGPYFIRIRTHTEILAMAEAASTAKAVRSKPTEPVRPGPSHLKSLPIGAARSSAAGSSGSAMAQPAHRTIPPAVATSTGEGDLSSDWVLRALTRIEANQRVIADALGIRLGGDPITPVAARMEEGGDAHFADQLRESSMLLPSPGARHAVQGGMRNGYDLVPDQASLRVGTAVGPYDIQTLRYSDEMIFAPPMGSQVHSCFACCLFVPKLCRDMDHIYSLRRSVGRLLSLASTTASLIAGRTVQQWAAEIGLAECDFVRLVASPPFRAGTICDIYLSALILGMSLWAVGSTRDCSMCSHSTAPFGLIRCDDSGYFVTYVPDEPLDLQKFFEMITELPLQLISEPRASEMTSLLNSSLPNYRQPVYLDKQFIHSHCAECSCHVRVLIAFLDCPAVDSDEPPRMQVSLSGIRASRPLAKWTSFASVAVELDIDSSDPQVLLEAYQYMDNVTYNRLEHYMEELLDKAVPSLQRTSEICLVLLERAAMNSFATFRRFVHKFRFLVYVPGVDALFRLTFSDFQAQCRLLGKDPTFCIFDEDTTSGPDVPCIVLAQEQALHVCTSVRASYGVGLIPYDDSASRSLIGGTSVTLDSVEGGANAAGLAQWSRPLAVTGGAKSRRVNSDILVRIALRISLPIVSGHLSEQTLTHLLRSDTRLATSINKCSNTRQVLDAISACCKRAGLVEQATAVAGISCPTSVASDSVAQLRAPISSAAAATSPRAESPSQPEHESNGSDSTRAIQMLRAEHDALSIEVKSMVSWAEQFEQQADPPPGTVVRDAAHFRLADQFANAQADIAATRMELNAVISDLKGRLQSLQ